MSILVKKAHVLTNGIQEDITLYSTLSEVQNMGKEFIVDGVTCYAKYGGINDAQASKAKILISQTTYALLKVALLPYGNTIRNVPGSYGFTPPIGCNKIRVTACAGGGGGGSSELKIATFARVGASGGAGGKGASIKHKILNVVPGYNYSVTIGRGGGGGTTLRANGSSGEITSFGDLLKLSGGTGGTYGYVSESGGASAPPTFTSNKGRDGINALPQEINIESYGIGGISTIPTASKVGTYTGHGNSGTGGYMLIEWGEGI